MAERRALGVDRTSVLNAYNACDEDDILVIPPGTATWSSALTVNKGITIQGAGSASTVITATGGIFSLAPGSNKAIRVTALGFVGGNRQINIVGSLTNSYVLDNIRIDHCASTGGVDNIYASGWIEGLIDNNTFFNGSRVIMVVGDNHYAWGRTIAGGTSHALFIEDNTFTQTNAGGSSLNENIYHQEGGRTVTRHNHFDASGYTSYNACLFDSHGTQGYQPLPSGIRGQPIIEVYDNIFDYHHTYRVMFIRGGSNLIYNNEFNYVTSSVEIAVTEEEGWQTAFFSPLRTAWPAQDQIVNSFFWGNTRNGSAITDIYKVHGEDSEFIQENRDYFMHAPQSSGGYEYYTGAKQGGSTTYPTSDDTGSTAFSPTGANAYYPYTAYTYPHPLQGGVVEEPEIPPATTTRFYMMFS